jgi:hypothetical protein
MEKLRPSYLKQVPQLNRRSRAYARKSNHSESTYDLKKKHTYSRKPKNKKYWQKITLENFRKLGKSYDNNVFC